MRYNIAWQTILNIDSNDPIEVNHTATVSSADEMAKYVDTLFSNIDNNIEHVILSKDAYAR